jgi:hypothetical protein
MVKCWSTATQFAVYEDINTLWLKRATPSWMKDKAIRLTPAVPGSSDLNHMRPISLYEVAWKIWITIIVKRILLVWHQNDGLHCTQYGYRLDNRIKKPLTNIINKVENALHPNITTLVNFWDARRAVDSIPRHLQNIVWL